MNCKGYGWQSHWTILIMTNLFTPKNQLTNFFFYITVPPNWSEFRKEQHDWEAREIAFEEIREIKIHSLVCS